MAVRARLIAPNKPRQEWPWHDVSSKIVRANLLTCSQRRMEAETYLSGGYGIKRALESLSGGWEYFSEYASAKAPPRIKQVLVSPESGTPYLNTSQVFDPRPKPRKWLALSKTTKAEERLVREGTILLMASATVGRSIIATKQHENTVISHHFMRISIKDPSLTGWIYGFLQSSQGQAMISGSQYASVIRHVEPTHLAGIPVPNVSKDIAAKFQEKFSRIVDLRNSASLNSEQAERCLLDAVGHPKVDYDQAGFSVKLSDVRNGRRRLEGNYFDPKVRAIVDNFPRFDLLSEVSSRVWWPNRFKRISGPGGMPYMSAADVFTTNPYALKSILIKDKADLAEFLVQPGWIVMARSGQTYGLNGSAKLMTDYHRRYFLSDDLIRIAPDPAKIRSGYLITALTHPILGRPLVIREAYGMSIPHLDPNDISKVPIVRLDKTIENQIADYAEAAAANLAEAEELERNISAEASEITAVLIGE